MVRDSPFDTNRTGNHSPNWVNVTPAMLEQGHHLIRDGQVILGDTGFAGRELEAFVDSIRAHLIRPDRKDEKPRFGSVGGIHQWIESVFDTLKGQLGQRTTRPRTPRRPHPRRCLRPSRRETVS
jgi:hypothetical protein